MTESASGAHRGELQDFSYYSCISQRKREHETRTHGVAHGRSGSRSSRDFRRNVKPAWLGAGRHVTQRGENVAAAGRIARRSYRRLAERVASGGAALADLVR